MTLKRFVFSCTVMVMIPLAGHAATTDPQILDGVAHLQSEWARIKYDLTDKDQQTAAIHKLEADGEKLLVRFPENPELQIWQGIVLSTDAGIDQGISALGKVRDARELFEKAISTDPAALDGSAYTSLGSLYYQVPGWPLAFGSDTKAEEFLKKALALNPNGIDPNFFYGDFLLQQDRYSEAKTYFEKALNAPDRPNRPRADAGRRAEIAHALDDIARKSSK
jgi:tetratricopeptide (TPR) repeat protein